MKVLGIDFETTGLDTAVDRPTEIGAVVFDSQNSWKPEAELSSLLYDSEYTPLSDEVKQVTGLTDEMLQTEGKPFPLILGQLCEIAKDVEYIVAHNREFDRAILEAEVARTGLGNEPLVQALLNKPWLCTVEDMEHTRRVKCRTLSHMALDYGVSIDPADLHRAVGDVRLMGKMLAASGFAIEKMIALVQTPWVYVQTLIPAPWTDGEKGKTAATARGFRWERYFKNGPHFPKAWVKRIKENKVEEETEAMKPYKVQVIHKEEMANARSKTETY